MIHLKKKVILFCLLCLAGGLLVSCVGTTTPDPLAATNNGSQPTAYADLPLPALATLGPEIKRFSGQGNNVENTITVDTKQFLRINWKQQCLSNFYLSTINTTPGVTPDPIFEGGDGSETVLSVAANPSYGYVDYEFEPGMYKINIESDGSWEIWVEKVVQEIEATPEP